MPAPASHWTHRTCTQLGQHKEERRERHSADCNEDNLSPLFFPSCCSLVARLPGLVVARASKHFFSPSLSRAFFFHQCRFLFLSPGLEGVDTASLGRNMSTFKITEKQYNDAEQTFNLFDKKGNGTVSTSELANVFKSLGLQVEDDKLKYWADAVDEEAQGYITWEQFKPVFETKLTEDEEEREMREAFRVLDKGNKGVIPVEDLRWLLKSLGDDLTEEEIEDMILETDTDGSGTVDYDEFRTLMNSN